MPDLKKYESLGELLTEWREINGKSQADLGVMLDVDERTIGRWENGQTLINRNKELEAVEKMNIPYQVIHNLNSDFPIGIYYDFQNRRYSMSLALSQVNNADFFKAELPMEGERIFELSNKVEAEFIDHVRGLSTKAEAMETPVILEAAKRLQDLNQVLHDQTGHFAGYTCFIPLKLESYERLKNKEIEECDISMNDLADGTEPYPWVYYFYSLYADTVAHGYYLLSNVFGYFKQRKSKEEEFDYIISGLEWDDHVVGIMRAMGLKPIWKEPRDDEKYPTLYFMEGNFDMYLFGKA